ncbi:hypothetical protein TB2_028719 [Malus domestica]
MTVMAVPSPLVSLAFPNEMNPNSDSVSTIPAPERLIPNFRVASEPDSVENHVATLGDEAISNGRVTYGYLGTLNGATGWRRKASLAQAFERFDF